MLLLKNLLSPDDCAKCRYCCSFRRSTLPDTPVFLPEVYEKLKAKYPEAKFKKITRNGYEGYMMDLYDCYKTNDPDEEVLCIFNRGKGCILSEEYKPFKCSAWPFAAMRKNGELLITLSRDCRFFEKINSSAQTLLDSGLEKQFLNYVQKNPLDIIDYRENFQIIKILVSE